jgi:hypothetical protein
MLEVILLFALLKKRRPRLPLWRRRKANGRRNSLITLPEGKGREWEISKGAESEKDSGARGGLGKGNCLHDSQERT